MTDFQGRTKVAVLQFPYNKFNWLKETVEGSGDPSAGRGGTLLSLAVTRGGIYIMIFHFGVS